MQLILLCLYLRINQTSPSVKMAVHTSFSMQNPSSSFSICMLRNSHITCVDNLCSVPIEQPSTKSTKEKPQGFLLEWIGMSLVDAGRAVTLQKPHNHDSSIQQVCYGTSVKVLVLLQITMAANHQPRVLSSALFYHLNQARQVPVFRGHAQISILKQTQ